jgi:hypothetical protein
MVNILQSSLEELIVFFSYETEELKQENQWPGYQDQDGTYVKAQNGGSFTRGGFQAYHDLTQSGTPIVQYGSHSQILLLEESVQPESNIPIQSVYTANMAFRFGGESPRHQDNQLGNIDPNLLATGYGTSEHRQSTLYTQPYPFRDNISTSQEGSGFLQDNHYVDGVLASDPLGSGASPDAQSTYGKIPIARINTVACPHCEKSFQNNHQLR